MTRLFREGRAEPPSLLVAAKKINHLCSRSDKYEVYVLVGMVSHLSIPEAIRRHRLDIWSHRKNSCIAH